MQYRPDKYGNPLSVLAFGCMRFPRKLGRVDIEATEQLIKAAVAGGVNYFDTAYIYPGSEAALGEILEKNGLREQVHITTKLPHYLIKSRERLDEIFAEELARLHTDHVDYYLMHMLTDVATWERLCALGIREWIAEKKQSGAIRQVGFSYHGNADMFCRLVDAYEWDLCMIQYNYMDENSQAGRRGLRYAHERGLPVMIMEPLRGGRLVKGLPPKAREIFSKEGKPYSPAAWAFRWLWNQGEVTAVLSGMNSLPMLEENLKTASATQVGELGEADEEMLARVVGAISEGMRVGCTGCGYCMPCPKNVDIPGTFAAYNRMAAEGKFWGLKDYFMCTALRKNPTAASQCVGCGKCETHCPQGIAIRRELAAASAALEGPLYRTAKRLASKFVKF